MMLLADLVKALESGETTGAALVEQALGKIKDGQGEGERAFVFVDEENARADAKKLDALRAEGKAPSPYAGIPVSVKDLFDVAGQTTLAGSVALKGDTPASQDAPIVARLRAAGFVIIGRTHMTEFAYSGLGLNPHYPAPRSPYDRTGEGRIPGGSSSGAAVSVADGMVPAAIGTDTGGSCRIPAAFCGIVGFKPTAKRVPLDGAYPLSASLDSIGPLAGSVTCCAHMDAILANAPAPELKPRDVASLRLGVLRNYVLDSMDQTVAALFERTLDRLAATGATLVDIELPDLDKLPELNARGGLVAAEAYRHHSGLIAERGDAYDQRVRVRILKAKDQQDGEYDALLNTRATMIEHANAVTNGVDAVLMPTVPVIPPEFSELDDDAEFGRINLLALRNPTVANFLDRCAISLPVTARGEAPVGLMLMGQHMGDEALFNVAAGVEALLADASGQ